MTLKTGETADNNSELNYILKYIINVYMYITSDMD